MTAPTVQLARRDGVELVRTGRWPLMTGTWEPTRDDIRHAIDALNCPAVRRPVLKIGHLDDRFTPPNVRASDGEPSIGWVDNLRAADNGNLLLGDFVGVPGWINEVMASAWPDRSIEGDKNYRCSLGHTHPFALHAVSLLGVTRPGIGTLKSLQDVADLYGVQVAAAGEENGERVQVTIRAAAEVHTGAMVALIPTKEDAARLAVDEGELAEELHLTLRYLGKAADLGARGIQDVIDRVSTVANGLPRIEADISSVAVFNPGDANDRDTCLVWLVAGDIIDAVHELVEDALDFVEAPIPPQHRPYTAHITAAYTDDLGRLGELVSRVGPVRFDRLRLAFGGEFTDIPLMEWPGEDVDDDAEAVAAAAGNADALHDYWTKGKGLARWKGKPHPWTALFKQLLKHLGPDKAKRTTSKWYREVMGHTPNQRGKVAASADPPEPDIPPTATTTEETHELTPPDPGGVSVSPAAEPDPSITEEDMVSTLNADLRQALGLADDVDDAGVLAKVGELKSRAETPPPAEPSPEQVAASAAADEKKAELEKEVAALSSRMAEVTAELAAAKAEKVETVKASVLDTAVREGKIKPADKEQWSKDYDEAPGVTTRVLASIAPGTAVPVMAAGHTGPAEPDVADPQAFTDAELDAWASQLGVDPKELSNG